MNKIEIIIFDADGTIFDSMPFTANVFADVLEKYGIPIEESRSYMYATAGTSTYKQFNTILKKHHKSVNMVNSLVKEFNGLIEGGNTKLFADIVQTFKKLNHYKKIVSTNLRQDVLNKKIKHYRLHLYLDKYFGTNGFKSKEEHFGEIKKVYHLSDREFKNKVMLVGDGKTDMKFARKYGILGIGKIGINDAKTLKQAGASYIIHNLLEILKIVENGKIIAKKYT